MADLSHFKSGLIVGARIIDARVTKTVELFGVAWNTVSKVMTAFEKERKTSSLKQNSGRKRKLSDSDRWIVRKDHENTAPKITAELNDYLQNPVSSKNCKKGAAQNRISRERLQSENRIRINLFEICKCFHYFVQALNIYIYIYIYIYIELPYTYICVCVCVCVCVPSSYVNLYIYVFKTMNSRSIIISLLDYDSMIYDAT